MEKIDKHKGEVVWWHSGPGSVFRSELNGSQVPEEVEFKMSLKNDRLEITRYRLGPFYFGDIGEVMTWKAVQYKGDMLDHKPFELKVKLMDITTEMKRNGFVRKVTAHFLVLQETPIDKTMKRIKNPHGTLAFLLGLVISLFSVTSCSSQLPGDGYLPEQCESVQPHITHMRDASLFEILLTVRNQLLMNHMDNKDFDARVWSRQEIDHHLRCLAQEGVDSWGRVSLTNNQVRYLRNMRYQVVDITCKMDRESKYVVSQIISNHEE